MTEQKERESMIMALLEVRHLKKTYTNRFGTNQVEALKDVTFSMEEAREQLVQIVSSINSEQVQNQTESAGAESAFIEPQQ